jgi:hypothetical protein
MDDMMTDVALGVFGALLIGGAITLHWVEWHLYTTARAERDLALEKLAAATAAIEGWREAANRAILVAELGKRVTAHATVVVQAAAGVVGSDALSTERSAEV